MEMRRGSRGPVSRDRRARVLCTLLGPLLLITLGFPLSTPTRSAAGQRSEAAKGGNTAKRRQPEVLKATLTPAVLPPGTPLRITYHWQAAPLGRDYTVFVHCVDPSGRIRFQDDHTPPVPTSRWTGPVRYTRTVEVPADAPEGAYRVMLGLFAPVPNVPSGERPELAAGSGVAAEADRQYQVGTLRIDRAAPRPPPVPLDSAKRPTLNLRGYTRTFSEEFAEISVSVWGPGTRWIAHTPFNADFGEALFTDPMPGFPFEVTNGILTIRARKQDGRWRAGLLASVDAQGRGFSQQYGYFEMRARFPRGPGTWPAFWMNTVGALTDKTKTMVEVDVVEQYGHAPRTLFARLHHWRPGGGHESVGERFRVADMTVGFHNYGLLWDEKKLVWYFDGVELWRQPTPPEARAPMFLMVNLALGGGWPIDKTPDPSEMEIDYLRAYAKRRPGRK